jgi:predicted ribosomally synthesized peptide with nif11-like leader
MSIESAKEFYSRMTTDQAFRTQLEQATTREERQQILQVAGYDFTPEDWEAAKTQIQASNSANGELSDAELTAVSGGLSILPGFPDVPSFPFTPLYGAPTIDPLA